MTRRAISITVQTLGSRADAGLSESGSPEERIALVETLTREAWQLSGQDLPGYPRASAPVVLRPLRPERA